MSAKRPQAFAERSQASASVRTKRSRRVGHAGKTNETKIVAKRRTVVTFYGSHYKNVNSHRDRGGRGRETQNCRHFWTRLGCPRLNSVNSRRDRGGRRREAQHPELSSLLDSSRVVRVSKVSTVTGIGGGRRREAQDPELSSLLDSSRVVAS